MNKGLKKGLKITGVTVAVILVFMLVLPFMFKDKVITIVKKEANEMLNAKLDFESLDISLFSHFPRALFVLWLILTSIYKKPPLKKRSSNWT